MYFYQVVESSGRTRKFRGRYQAVPFDAGRLLLYFNLIDWEPKNNDDSKPPAQGIISGIVSMPDSNTLKSNAWEVQRVPE